MLVNYLMENFANYKNKGLTGLGNLGNTCFINSCMQIISHTYELNDFLNKNSYKKRLNDIIDTELLCAWDELRSIMWSKNCTVAPNKFLHTIHKVSEEKEIPIFTGFDQNDLPEFLIFIINCFHNAIARPVNMSIDGESKNDTDKMAIICFEKIKQMYAKDYSEVWNLFYGIHVSQLHSISTGEIVSTTPEPYFIIDLALPETIKEPTLMDCFDFYVNGEMIEGVFNEKKGIKETMQRTLQFWSFPSILVIDVKRFNSSNRKKQNMVNFPLCGLDLSKYVIGYNKTSYIYDLYGVCNHSGSVAGGHYTAFVKNANGKWYLFNDTSISEVGNTNNIISPKAYCFFYRKRQ